MKPAHATFTADSPQRRLARETDGYAIIRDAVRQILSVIDEPGRDGVEDTPDRVARMYLELTRPEPFVLTCFENSGHYDQMIVEDDIPFYSLCEHHIIPFFGTAKVAYIPKGRIVGLSKLARTVDHYTRGLQTQERITNGIADFLMDRLDAVLAPRPRRSAACSKKHRRETNSCARHERHVIDVSHEAMATVGTLWVASAGEPWAADRVVPPPREGVFGCVLLRGALVGRDTRT